MILPKRKWRHEEWTSESPHSEYSEVIHIHLKALLWLRVYCWQCKILDMMEVLYLIILLSLFQKQAYVFDDFSNFFSDTRVFAVLCIKYVQYSWGTPALPMRVHSTHEILLMDGKWSKCFRRHCIPSWILQMGLRGIVHVWETNNKSWAHFGLSSFSLDSYFYFHLVLTTHTNFY